MKQQGWQTIAKNPRKRGMYLVFAPSADPKKPLIALAFYDGKSGWIGLVAVWLAAITHWMPLPEPPAA